MKHSRSSALRRLCAGVAVAALCAVPTHADAPDVRLTHSVQKVVSTAAADGTTTTALVAADRVTPGDELVYTIRFENVGAEAVAAGRLVITNPVPEELEYLPGTATGEDMAITFSVDGGRRFAVPEALTVSADGVVGSAPASAYTTLRWVLIPALPAGASGDVSFRARLKSP
jgi:uncharacterized repeat protein (TIGR01451 family)